MRFIVLLLSTLFVSCLNVNANPVEITEDNWETLLASNEWMVEL